MRPVDVTPELEKPMLVVELHEPGHAPRVVSFTRHTLGIGAGVPTIVVGRMGELRVVSPSVGRYHLSLFEGDGVLWAGARKLLTIDGRALGQGAHPLRVGSEVLFGDATLWIRGFTPIAPPDFAVVEGELLALAKEDPLDGRLVYADALEEGGWLVRAEYLRVQVRIARNAPLSGDEEAHDRFVRKLMCARAWLKAVGTAM